MRKYAWQSATSAKQYCLKCDSGDTRYKDATRLWAFKEFPERHDNLLCAVLVLEDRVVVKTVMHHFSVL